MQSTIAILLFLFALSVGLYKIAIYYKNKGDKE